MKYTHSCSAISRKKMPLMKVFYSAISALVFLDSSVVNAKVVEVAPEITDYQLQCDEVFSCPKIIDRRVDFWVDVFHKWKKQNRILHDSRQPERVYMVLDTKDECRRKNPKGEVRSGLNVVKKRLDELSNLVSKGASQKKLQKHPYYKLFPNASLKYIQDAKKSIRCLSGNREMFEQALQNFQIYKPYILNALQERNLPLDIQYLPFVESSYNPKAFSFAGAAGMWQIMPATARSLGLQIGSSVDERFEPEFATLAAAKYFRDSIDRLSKTAKEDQHSTLPKDINPFVITSYNYGVRGMQRAISQVGTDYEKLLKEYKSRSFQIAVRNFYASFLAARHVAQNQATFFPNLTFQQHITDVNRIALPKPLFAKQLISTLNVPKTELAELNPGVTRRVWKGQHAIPTGYILKVPFKTSGWNEETNQLKKLRGATTGNGRDDSGRRHKVRSGQTACGVAKRYKVRCKDLISLNKLNRKAVIKIGQNLKIPGGVQKYRLTKIVKASQELREKLASQTTQIDVNSTGSVNDIRAQTESTAEVLQLEQPPQVENLKSKQNSSVSSFSLSPFPTGRKTTSTLNGSVVQSEIINNQVQNGLAVEVEPSTSESTESKPTEITIVSKSKSNSNQVRNKTPSPDLDSEVNKVVNLETSIRERDGRFWVSVLPSESIGLYADWLKVGTTRSIRQLNKLRGKASINVFQRIYLPKMTQKQKSDFNLSRNEYHLELQLQYFQRFKVSKIVRRNVKANETMWSISKNNRIPMWLLMQYNQKIKQGQLVRIPIIKPKKT